MRDGSHFQRLRDFFRSRLSDFLQASLLVVHHAWQQCPHPLLLPVAARVDLNTGPLSYFSAPAASSFCWTFTAVSHLSSAGPQLLWGLHGLAPSALAPSALLYCSCFTRSEVFSVLTFQLDLSLTPQINYYYQRQRYPGAHHCQPFPIKIKQHRHH